ncbi:MAG: hypothetical protein KAW51_10805 [Candidatus Lokiarchaeota archaeon]|nr:hypothetical protein [Candidatus Lokiarchaeota archaeon]
MSKFFENIKGKIKKLPSLFAKRLVKISLIGDFLEITFPSLTQKRNVKELLEDLIIKIDNISVYNVKEYPNDFDVKLNDIFYPNQYLSEIYDKSLKIGDKLTLVVPNRINILDGNYNIEVGTHSAGIKAKFDANISPFLEKAVKTKTQLPKKKVYRQCTYCGKITTDASQVICEDCGSELKKV